MAQFGPAGQNANERKLLLRAEGPILDVTAQSSKSLAGLNCKGLIDTGASVNCIDNNTARKLGLNAIDYRDIQSATERTKTPVYIGLLNIPALNASISGQFYGTELLGSNKAYHYLLGRDFLSDFIFNYDGTNGAFQLTKPQNGLVSETFDE